MVTDNDNINELITLVRSLLNTVNTLGEDVANLLQKILNINALNKLLDVKIDNITFGDILHYSNDGKWHNIQPNKIISNVNSSTGVYKLLDLEDVVISTPSNGQSITYSSSDGKWHNNTISGGGTIDPGILDTYLTKTEAKNTYFPLNGGTIKGDVKIKGNLLTTGGITLYNLII